MIIFFKMQALGNDFILIDCMKESPRYNLSILSKYLSTTSYKFKFSIFLLRIKSNPSEVVSVGDIVKAKVIGIDREKQKVSLSMKL